MSKRKAPKRLNGFSPEKDLDVWQNWGGCSCRFLSSEVAGFLLMNSGIHDGFFAKGPIPLVCLSFAGWLFEKMFGGQWK